MISLHFNKHVQRISSQMEKDVKHFIYMRSNWTETEVDFLLLLSTNHKCYRGQMTNEMIKAIATELDRNYEEFYKECKLALTSKEPLPGYDYEINVNDMKFNLICCRGYESLYMDVTLREVSNNGIYELCDTALELIATTEQQLTTDASNAIQEEVLVEYKKFVKESKDDERKMLKKFVLLLNNKKEKIAELEEKLKLLQKRQRGGSKNNDIANNDEQMRVLDSGDNDETIYVADIQPKSPLEQSRTEADASN